MRSRCLQEATWLGYCETFAAIATAFAKPHTLVLSGQAASFFAFFAFMYRSMANNVAGHKRVLLRPRGLRVWDDCLTVVSGAAPSYRAQ